MKQIGHSDARMMNSLVQIAISTNRKWNFTDRLLNRVSECLILITGCQIPISECAIQINLQIVSTQSSLKKAGIAHYLE
ncbi:hypothetical protein [Labilibaculum euxinus]|uniref:Uncharacterized protein n=1 Tax=Labilibaculum euxinus TaxID=2686357 RepID=A0A7M4D311_9BACT|nr:hypothetical protein [Labilibaculum euxinus]MBN2595734.1 hypothetical protein [Marinifilaceae bacterium]MUP37040.1 hypothetical protein [Labilibaculum euxinus]MVB06245.1 hypothetical protein [Labilibaculum euxinus]